MISFNVICLIVISISGTTLSSNGFTIITNNKQFHPKAFSRQSLSSNQVLYSTTSNNVQDTPKVLPNFNNKEEYLSYMESVAVLPKGFATGTADGKFISVEAPGMGKLPIRGTVIYLTEGPTDSWAAVFTSNMVCCFRITFYMYMHLGFFFLLLTKYL
jgi:hypothetical protein